MDTIFTSLGKRCYKSFMCNSDQYQLTQSDNFGRFRISFFCLTLLRSMKPLSTLLPPHFSLSITLWKDMAHSDQTRVCSLLSSTRSGNSRFVCWRPWQGTEQDFTLLHTIHGTLRKVKYLENHLRSLPRAQTWSTPTYKTCLCVTKNRIKNRNK
jgi:hypothetical protein